jgi:hypothetical protein
MRHNETRPGHKRRRLQITGVTQTIKHLTRREWDELAPLFDDLSYCQGGSYAEEAAKDVGAHLEFVAILQAESVVGLANIRVKQVPFSGIGVAYALHAPLSRQRHALSEDFFGYCLDALRAEYVERRGVILRIVPPVNGGYRLDAQAAVLEQRGFRRSNRHKAHETFLLDLTDSLSNIRETFDRKWRNHLSKAQRSNVDVTISETLASFDHFEPLLLGLIRKKGFTPPARDVAFFRRVSLTGSITARGRRLTGREAKDLAVSCGRSPLPRGAWPISHFALSRWVVSPNGESHLVMARGTIIDPDISIAFW